jgi:predicted TIM-barrel fold metal-dependent hydrolase
VAVIMARGLIIDAHTHPVGHRMDRGSFKDYRDYVKQIGEPGAQEEQGRLDKILEQMDHYGVAKAIGLVAIGHRSAPDLNQRMIQVVREHGGRFPAVMIGFNLPPNRNHFSGKDAADEIEPLLDLPEVKGVGEWALPAAAAGMMDWPELLAKYRPVFDVIAAHERAVLFHTGLGPYGHSAARPATGNRSS